MNMGLKVAVSSWPSTQEQGGPLRRGPAALAEDQHGVEPTLLPGVSQRSLHVMCVFPSSTGCVIHCSLM